jgi:hypothetical protein
MILCFFLILCILNVIKEIWRFVVAFRSEERYDSSDKRTLLTFSSIAYIITIIIFGL